MKKVLTIVLDGFGLRKNINGNAVKLANMPTFRRLWNEYPHCQLLASEEAVGLEKGQMGNSEVGHTTIGAGRLIKQNFMQINDMFNNGDIYKNQVFQELVSYAKNSKKTIHLMGLTSDGKIHSHIGFIKMMIEALYKENITNVYLHAITDGRDTSPTVSYRYIKDVDDLLRKYNMGYVVSVCGRYYALDRDKKWERTKIYSQLVTENVGTKVKDLEQAINFCYQKNVTDEFLPPMIVNDGMPIKDGDILLWLNYRPDRAKQILTVLTDANFNEYQTTHYHNLKCYTFYPIAEAKNSKHFLEVPNVKNSLGVYLSTLGLSQARIAETEKYAHVTYFFDGGKELQLEKCDRFLIPSPKVATYDLKPSMSALEVTSRCIDCLDKDYDFIFMNFANPDMVGHTGNLKAAISALETIDQCLAKIMIAAKENYYTVIILSDHGNCDEMIDDNGNVCTTHSLYPVPFIITDKKVKLENGNLTQVAPTILKYMDIALPKEMKDTKPLIVD